MVNVIRIHVQLTLRPRCVTLNIQHIWETILQPFGYLIPHMNKKTGGTEDRWRVLLSPHTERSMRMQQIDFIAQRTRFYHAIIDSRSLKSGQSYDKLKRVFVIFICPYDPFGDDRMIYTIRNHCVENPELPYEDGARTIFLYTKGRKGRDNESLSQLLDYMENTTRENAVSEELEAIQEMVDVVKEDAEVTVAYMKGFERDQMFLEEGKKQERENTLKEKQRADEEQKRADMEQQRADAAAEEIAKLRKQLEEMQRS